jgi:mono/diheme cytochrome c family protein
MDSKKNIYRLLAATLAIAGCTTALYIPVQEHAQKTGVPLDSLLEGRNLYVNNCGSCHGLKSPEKRTSAEWQKILPKMQKKAKINDAKTELIRSYLLANCKTE